MQRSTNGGTGLTHLHIRRGVSDLICVLLLAILSQALHPAASLAQWVKVPGQAREIGAGGDKVWIVGMNEVGNGDFGLYEWNGSNWEPRPGGAVRVAVGPAGHAWIVKATGAVFSWDGSQWVRRATIEATDIAVSQKGTFVLADKYHDVYKLNLQERRWDMVNDRSVRRSWDRIAAHPNGGIWVTTRGASPESPGPITVFPPGDYECREIPGLRAHDIAVGKNGSVWAIGSDAAGSGGYAVNQWRGRSGWSTLAGGAGDRITVDGRGVAWVIARDHTIWHCSTGDVLPLPTPGARVSFFNEAGYVSRYSVAYVLDKKPYSKSTGNMSLGNRKSIDIPPNAIAIVVKGEGKTGLVWEPWRKTFEKKYSRPTAECFKSYGTTLDQKWNNNCEASITQDDMDKFFQLISAL